MRRRRYLVVLLVVVLLVVLRVALPSILRSQIEKQANATIAGELAIGDVDLWLLRGAVALKDVALRAEDAASDAPPITSFERLYVRIGYLALFRRTVRIEEVTLDGPAVYLERLASGAVPIPGLRPVAPAVEPSPAPGTPWNVVVDRAALRTGRFRVLDRVPTPPEAVELSLDNIGFTDFTLLHSDDGVPGHGSIEAEFGDGKVAIDTAVTTRPAGYAFEATVDVTNLPLDRMQQHAPELGWSGFAGRLDAHVTLRAEPNELPVSSGTVAVRDLRVEVPGDPEPALAWRKLAVDVEEFGIARRRALVKTVVLDGGALVVTPRGVTTLPLLRGREVVAAAPTVPTTTAGPVPDPTAVPTNDPTAVPSDDPTAPPTSDPAAVPPADSTTASSSDPAEPPPPWTWRVGTVEITDTRATVVLEPPPLVVEIVKGAVTGLDSTPGARAAVDLQLEEEQGTLGLTGTVGLDPLAMDLVATLRGLALGRLLAASGPSPVLLPTGTLAGELTLHADQGPLHVAGSLSVADLGLTLSEGAGFAVAWKQLDVGIKEARVPGVLPGSAPAAPEPIRLDLDRLKLVGPAITLTRTATGLVLPGRGAPAAPASTKPAPASAKPWTPVPAKSPAPAVEAASKATTAATGPGVTVALGLIDVEGGEVALLDQTVKPFYRGKLSALTMKARGVRYPENTFDDVTLTTTLPGGAPLEVDAKQVKGTITITVDGKALPLSQFNPYVTQAAGYSISDGRLSVNTKARFAPNGYDSKTNLVFDELGVAGAEGDTLFLQKVGIPLQVALSLLRDPYGKISLGVPMRGGKEGTQVDVGAIVAQALVQAILGAVTSPLKLLGAAGGLLAGGGGGALAPEPIPCGPGLPTVDAAAAGRVQQLGGALGVAPALRITLRGSAGGPDVRALQEAAVLADLQAKQGVLGGIRHLANRGERNAIRDFLATRAEGGKAELAPEYQKTLDDWAAAKTISADQLRALAGARAEGLKGGLTRDQGVDPARVAVGAPEVDPESGRPEVRIGFGG